jgi:hypothetical protein
MTSAAQITANQSNARTSTGPRTVEGKARVSRNAIRHGLTASHPVVRDDEHEEFAALRDGLAAELDPQGAVETVVFQQILLAAWNLQRLSRLEAEASSGTLEDFTDPATVRLLDRLSLYQSRAQRAWSKGIAELRTLQTNRALRAAKLDAQEEVEVPAIASINDLTKQTHSEVTAEAFDIVMKLINVETGVLLRGTRAKFDGDQDHAQRESV